MILFGLCGSTDCYTWLKKNPMTGVKTMVALNRKKK